MGCVLGTGNGAGDGEHEGEGSSHSNLIFGLKVFKDLFIGLEYGTVFMSGGY